MIGDPGVLAFEISWPEESPPELAGLGWGDLVLWFGGNRVWVSQDDEEGSPLRPVRWTWLDLVEHLARSWPFLRHEENAPFGLVADAPEELRDPRLLAAVRGHSEVEVEDAVHGFQQRHDLAAGLKGIFLPSVWLVREGLLMRVRAEGRDLWLPLKKALELLEAFVAEVLGRASGSRAPRRVAAEEAWKKREGPASLVWALRAHLPVRTLKEWTPDGMTMEEWWGDPASGRESPMMAVVRMSAPLSESTRREIVRQLAALSARRTQTLDRLSADAESRLESVRDEPPHVQGHALAAWLREALSVGAEDPVDPEQILTAWGVEVGDLPSGLDRELDAVACWGGGRGPAVLINPRGKHSQYRGGRRATMAHEIAHLLVDRRRRLPLAEVFGGSTPAHLEKRARAFAAELLLPRSVVARVVARSRSLDSAAKAMQRKYGVSRQLLAWQIHNGAAWDRLGCAERDRVEKWCRDWRAPAGGGA
jgi:hypothetical protein